MNPQQGGWRKSSYSGGTGGDCIEVCSTLSRVRDSKSPTVELAFADGVLPALVAAVKEGRFTG